MDTVKSAPVNGLDLAALAEEVETIDKDASTAKVKISYTLLNTPLSAESDLVKVGERWYGKEMLEGLKKKDAAVSEPAAAPAPATN